MNKNQEDKNNNQKENGLQHPVKIEDTTKKAEIKVEEGEDVDTKVQK